MFKDNTTTYGRLSLKDCCGIHKRYNARKNFILSNIVTWLAIFYHLLFPCSCCGSKIRSDIDAKTKSRGSVK